MSTHQAALQLAIQIATTDHRACEGLDFDALHVTNECTPNNYPYWEEDMQWFADGGCKVHPDTYANIQVHLDPEAPSLDDGEPQYSILIAKHNGLTQYTIHRITWGVEYCVEQIGGFHMDANGELV